MSHTGSGVGAIVGSMEGIVDMEGGNDGLLDSDGFIEGVMESDGDNDGTSEGTLDGENVNERDMDISFDLWDRRLPTFPFFSSIICFISFVTFEANAPPSSSCIRAISSASFLFLSRLEEPLTTDDDAPTVWKHSMMKTTTKRPLWLLSWRFRRLMSYRCVGRKTREGDTSHE